MPAEAHSSNGSLPHQPRTARERTDALDRDGFFVWPELVADDVIDDHVRAHEAWLDERGRYTPQAWAELPRREQVRTFARDYAWHEQSPAALDLFYQPELVDFLRGHFGSEPAMRAPQTGERQRGSSIHTDGGVMDPPGSEVRVWIALEDIDPASGPVYMIAGTHHLIAGVRERLLDEHRDLATAYLAAARSHRPTEPTPRAFIEFGNEIARGWKLEIQSRRMPLVVPTLSKGDGIVFRTDVAHGTMPCADPTLTRRHALVFFASSDTVWLDWPECMLEGRQSASKRWTFARNDRGLYVADWLVL